MAEPLGISREDGSRPLAQGVFMNGFAEDKPNGYFDWRPSATFKDYPAESRSPASRNQERGRSSRATPTQDRKQTKRHTPATFPRTRYLGSGREKTEMEDTRQQLTFSDVEEVANENDFSEAAPSPGSQRQSRGNPEPDINSYSHPGGGESAQLNIPVTDMPNRNQVVARLVQIREYIKQASMVLSQIGEPGMGGLEEDEKVLQLSQLQEHLREQERGYLVLLERMLGENTTEMGQGRNSQNSDVSFATSVAESASINVDARSDISEASTVGTYTAKTRPRIESSLGNYQSEGELTSDLETDDLASATGSEVTGSFGLDTGELHEQYSNMLSKYDPVGQPGKGNPGGEPLANEMASGGNSSQDDVEVNEEIESLAGLRQQHDLLKKMLQQQEELRNLQTRQTTLMKLQKEIDSRLAENESSTEATPSEVSQQTEQSKTVTEASSVAEPPSDAESEKYKEALRDLRRRTLRRMLHEDHDQRLQQLAAQSGQNQREQEKAQMLSEEHEQLQGKLLELQQKKDDIGTLLEQLHALGANHAESASNVDSQSGAEGSQRNVAGGGGDGTKREGANMGTNELSKLQEVRHRLTELRDLVQEYQDTTEPLPNGDARHEVEGASSNLRNSGRRQSNGTQRRDHKHNQASTQTVGPPLINQSEDETQGTPSVTEEETETENESERGSMPVAWAEDPELQQKFRKLENAKQKLRELQELVSIVQETPEAAIGLPDDLAELAASLTEEMSEVMEGEEEEGGEDEDQRRGLVDAYSEISDGEVSEQTREAYYEAKMRQQRRELEKLMDERGRLLKVQRQLKDLNQKLPPVGMINNLSRGQNLKGRQTASATKPDALTPNRDEVYAEMRRHKILQEELRQKKRELAALMDRVKRNKMVNGDMNDLDDNDLFRVSMRSADVTAAATWGGSSQMSDTEENNDGYPSDDDAGAEEEEEEQDEDRSVAMTSDTYTIERQKYEAPLIESDYDEALLEMHGIRHPGGKYGKQQHPNLRQENLRPAEDLVDDMSQYSEDYLRLQVQVDHLQAQLEDSMKLTRTLVKDQQTMMNMMYQNSMTGVQPPFQEPSPPPSYGPAGYRPDPDEDPRLAELLRDYDLRLQHQQLQLNLNNAYSELFRQQAAIDEFYQQAGGPSLDNPNANNSAHGLEEEGIERNMYYHSPYDGDMYEGDVYDQYKRDTYSPYGRPGYVADGGYKSGPMLEHKGNSLDSSSRIPSKFENQHQGERAPSSLKAAVRAQSYLDQYNVYPRQAPTSRYTHPYQGATSYHVPPNSSQRSLESSEVEPSAPLSQPGVAAEAGGIKRMGKGKMDSSLRQTREVHTSTRSPVNAGVPPLDINSLLKKTERQRQRIMEGSSQGDRAISRQGTVNASVGRPAGAKAKSKMASNSLPTGAAAGVPSEFRPGLSSHLSGTAFLDTASMTSTMSYSSMPGELDQERMSYLRHGSEIEKQMSVKSQSEAPSEAESEYSLFESLRESIYSEVATLISQNESRPHFLIELFRALQALSTDYLRQRALYAFQDLVSKYLTEGEQAKEDIDELTGTYLHWPTATISEHTPSESFFTSEEDELKAQSYTQKSSLHPSDSKGSLTGMQFDYVENVESASSMSTPNSVGDFGFASEELGNTVIHLDKALQRMREYERMKAEAEASGGTTGFTGASSKPEDTNATASDVTSNSSAQDIGSESSFSDLTYPRIDTRQLDLQIKSIMQEVIPYLKEHMDDVCSPQLLAYICRLVMNLARQRDDSREFVMFFNRQLGSILEDSLAKFSGRKMRECGEDLLVDISEILFNELAFFRLMQDLDTAGDRLRKEIDREEGTAAQKTGDTLEGGTEDENVGEQEEGEEEGEDGEEDEDDDDEGDESEVTGTETGQEEGVTDNTTTDDEENEALAKTDDTIATVIEVGNKLVQEAMENVMTMATSFEAEELGKDRDDMFAAETMISENDEDSEPVGGMNIELSVSESKAVTYLGSEEDDNDQDDFSQKNDETETSLGMSSEAPASNPRESTPVEPAPSTGPSPGGPAPEDTTPEMGTEEVQPSPEQRGPDERSEENKIVEGDPPDRGTVEGNPPEGDTELGISPVGGDVQGNPMKDSPVEAKPTPESTGHQESTEDEVFKESESGRGNIAEDRAVEPGDITKPDNIVSPDDSPREVEESSPVLHSDDASDGQVMSKLKDLPSAAAQDQSAGEPVTSEEGGARGDKQDEDPGEDEKDRQLTAGDWKDANENDVTIDDLPPKLTSLSQMQVEARMAEEAAMTGQHTAVLESMVSGEDQLAGDGEALPEPEGMPTENGVMEQEPASGISQE